MKAMILAAGRGKRMQPLTNIIPKPLLKVHGRPLIAHQIIALAKAGITNVIINTGVMGNQISEYLGHGENYGVRIQYSHEGDNPIETAGGIIKALPFFENEPFFIVTNADIYTDFDYGNLLGDIATEAHIILVTNPSHNLDGDFSLEGNKVVDRSTVTYTYSGMGLYSADFFRNCSSGPCPLSPLLRSSAQANRLSGELYTGIWNDVGTPERLHKINQIKQDESIVTPKNYPG